MGQHDWYRNKEWSDDIELAFRARLSRSRDLYNKTQYLRIQASYLLSSIDPITQSVGVTMMNEVISSFPEVDGVIANKFDALVELGDYYYNKSAWEESFSFYQKAIEYDQTKTHNQDHAHRGYIKSAVLSKHKEAYPIGTLFIESVKEGDLFLVSEYYEHSLAAAMLYNELGQHEMAKRYADSALEALNLKSPFHEKDKAYASDREIACLQRYSRR